MSLLQPPFRLALIVKTQFTRYLGIKTGGEKGQREDCCECIKTRRSIIQETAFSSLHLPHGPFPLLKSSLLCQSTPLTKSLQSPMKVHILQMFSNQQTSTWSALALDYFCCLKMYMKYCFVKRMLPTCIVLKRLHLLFLTCLLKL